jgi:HPt (histidine-containing phosphotransfer) domain-containing protein
MRFHEHDTELTSPDVRRNSAQGPEPASVSLKWGSQQWRNTEAVVHNALDRMRSAMSGVAMNRMLGALIDELRERLLAVEIALGDQCQQQVHEDVQAIKDSARVLGAARLCQLCYALEYQSNTRFSVACDFALQLGTGQLLDEMAAELDRTELAVSSWQRHLHAQAPGW